MTQPGSPLTRRSALLAGTGAAAALPVLAGCGLGQSGGNAPAQGQAATPAAPVTVDVAWEQTTNDMGVLVQGQGKQLFEERHPGVTLNIISQGNDQTKVLTQVAAGTPPHVLFVNAALPTFWVNRGVLLPLEGYIQKDPANKKTDFAPNFWDIFTVSGKQYAIPREGGPTVLYYNKSIVQAGGVAAPNDAWNLATEYRDAAVKLTKPGDPPVFGGDTGNYRNWVWSNGGDIFDAALSKYTLDQPAAVEVMQLFQDFRYKLQCSPTPQDNAAQSVIQRFMNGGVAFFLGQRSAGNTAGFVQPQVGIAQHPAGRAGRKFGDIGNGVGVVQPNKIPDLAYQAGTWLISAEFQKLYFKARVGGVVARLSVLQSEEYLTAVLPREWNEYFARGVAGIKSPPKLSNWPEISGTLDKELAAFQNGQETAAAATARIAPQLNNLLKEAVKG
jgi:multiple sugar transport system substrate-binding protein